MPIEPYRLLVVANRTGPCPGLPGVVHRLLAGRPAEVHVVAPAITSRLRWAFSDIDEALLAARRRQDIATELLRASGIPTTGEVGDTNPLQAVLDALHVFRADAVLISTLPHGRSHWLERDLIGRARRRLDIAVHHVVSDFDAAEEPVAAGAVRAAA